MNRQTRRPRRGSVTLGVAAALLVALLLPMLTMGCAVLEEAVEASTLPEGVWECPESMEDAAYVGSRNSDKFHDPGCRWVNEIKASNRLCFESRTVAENFGYEPCGTCKP